MQPRQAVRAGLAMIPEDRKQHGLLLPQSIRFNATLGQLGELSGPLGWIDGPRERAAAQHYSRTIGLECRSIEQPVEQLSGGNQQKVVIARWLMRDARVLLFDEPTRGIDAPPKRTCTACAPITEQGKAWSCPVTPRD
jgi:ribose transport system ATP-binding protein